VDFGHSNLYENLLLTGGQNVPAIDDRARKETLAFIATRPRLNPNEEAIAPTYMKLAWRRILIWLNEKREFRVERSWKTLCLSLRLPVTMQEKHAGQPKGDHYDVASAQASGRRLSLRTEGWFRRKVWPRIGAGCAALAFSAITVRMFPDLIKDDGLAQWIDSETACWLAGKATIAGWAGITISACYLLTMAYVSYWFNRMKYRAPLDHTERAAPR